VTAKDGVVVQIRQGEARDEAAEALASFVAEEYLGHGKSNHETRPEIFAGAVDYFDKGILPRDAVVSEHRRYYTKWPQRKFQILSDSLKLTAKEPGIIDVTFTYSFTVSNARKTVSGVGATELTVKRDNGRFEIVREAGGVLERK
jgi:hypothetical protein